MNLKTHLSIAWGVSLAVLTVLEWNSLDRDPLRQQIITPFIERDITVSPAPAGSDAPVNLPFAERGAPAAQPVVEIRFNGPLFLAWFFGPVAVVHGLAWLWARAAP